MAQPIGKTVLADAIKLLEKPEAWVQHTTWQTKKVGVLRWGVITARCIDGAIIDAAEKYGGEKMADQARKLLYRHGGLAPQASSIHAWNDTEGRTHAQVMTFMRGALAAA